MTKLRDADYLIEQVAVGLDDYYLGRGEAPGVWHGAWAAKLGIEGVVDHAALRALLDGRDPTTGADLLAGRPMRDVAAFDATFSAPKSASVLWAFGTPEVAAAVSIAHVESVAAALDVLEAKAAVARQQSDGVRRRVATSGLAVATFVHRTSREGDPQLHTHCVIPNIVERGDGTHVALDAGAVYEWKRAVGCIYAEELRTRLSRRLGVEWGPDRNGTREMTGLTATQLRTFSKRTVAIEEHLAALAIDHADRAAVMRADEAASLATRPAKDPSRTPEEMAATWAAEADAVALPTGAALTKAVCGRDTPGRGVSKEEVGVRLVDPETGLCARRSRFGEAHVVEAVASLGGGRLDATGIVAHTREFLASPHAIRLIDPDPGAGRTRSRQWSTAAHLALEAHVLERLGQLAALPAAGVHPGVVERALAAEGSLGADQAEAIRALCAPGAALRLLAAPAGFGKTTAVHAAAAAQVASGWRVLGLATTNQAASELRDVGLDAVTLARFRIDVEAGGLAAGTTLVLDEVSQVATADAAWLLDLATTVPDTTLWCLGDSRQGRPVRAGGLAAELERLAAQGVVAAAALTQNRRQQEPEERRALARYRDGAVAESQAVRTANGWEHDHGTPAATRQALAGALVGDADRLGADNVVALCVSHADAEDIADRVREIRRGRGELTGPFLTGPGWGSAERVYAAGDRVLVHATLRVGKRRLHNGTVLTVTGVTDTGLTVSGPTGHGFELPAAFIAGHRRDAAPNVSHAVARTVDGAQGGTWTQVHLLGTAALDRYTGYVAQSRGRHATNTWNVTRLSDIDHGGIVVERDPAEDVLAAMERQPPAGFAAHDDPHVLDRALTAERLEHLEVIFRRPPLRPTAMAEVHRDLDRAESGLAAAAAELRNAQETVASVGPLARTRRHGRQQLDAARARASSAAERVDAAEAARRAAVVEVVRVEQIAKADQAWKVEHGWRIDRVAGIDRQLDEHWARAVVAATRQGDPLAFGVDRLRRARRTTTADLRFLEAGLPPDQRDRLARAEAEVAHRQTNLAHARRTLTDAEGQVQAASQRRWGRRDNDALARAEVRYSAARNLVAQAAEAVDAARSDMEGHRQAVERYLEAVERTAPERQQLERDARELANALAETRPERVVAAAHGDPAGEHLEIALGPAPSDPARRVMWCAIANEIEAHRDRTNHADHVGTGRLSSLLGARPTYTTKEWDRVAGLVKDAPALLDSATTIGRSAIDNIEDQRLWRETLERNVKAIDARRAVLEPPGRGMELGW
ncbi:MAG TPA: MobF family relaxase [Acidimicrobiales bacterium]|nr:MobF family relaxase [Acidimicrobiales bacterium]